MKTLLVIDDDESVRELLNAFLERAYQVHCAASAAEARAFLSGHSLPCAILCDARLAGESGFEFTASLRKAPQTADVPVILISGYSDTDTDRLVAECGATTFLPKPFTPAEVLATITSIVEPTLA